MPHGIDKLDKLIESTSGQQEWGGAVNYDHCAILQCLIY